jgi:phosphatidylserine/phosphatidylglycerophosphate/cardiolipin synthase-like enzyme
LIASARQTILLEGEEMADPGIEQALIDARQWSVQVQVILPSPGTSKDSNANGIATIQHGGVSVREDPQYYMHAKIIVVDGARAFVGSENISAASLDDNREIGILVAAPDVLQTLTTTFTTDWNVSRSV